MTVWSALAGMVAPIWFTVLVVVQGLLQPDYSHVALPISALAAWPLGWLQELNFVVFGALVLSLVVGLHRGVLPQPGRGLIGPIFLGVSALGLEVAALFPWRRADAGPVESSGHVVGAVMVFLGAGIGLVAISRRMSADPRWRSLAGYTLTCGVAMVAMFVALGALAIRDGAPLHPWAGLMQRLVLAIWFPCMFILANRLWRLHRTVILSARH